MSLMKESLILIAIGMLDLVITLALLGHGRAVEGNPIMAYYLQFGVGAFVLAKLALLFLPIFIAEWSKRYKPRFVRLMMRGAITAYVGVYLILFVSVNVVPRAIERTPVCPRSIQVAEHVK